ncbi:MAG: SDR family oxidoreductase [Nitriliruptoraceae bacterium]
MRDAAAHDEEKRMRVLVTGATGYIGGRLVPALLERGHEVVCAARTPAKLDARSWRADVEVARVDVLDRPSLDAAMPGVDAVYHLVHSMDGEHSFAERDRWAARHVRDAAAAAEVQRIVYLGGLGRAEDALSDHLHSRQEVGQLLADGPVPVTELRAAIILGSGSASFEMLRQLVEVLPIMITPRRVATRCQPIAIRDVLSALCDVLETEVAAGKIYELGGPDVLTYAELMQTYAHVAGLRRRIILPVLVLTPRLSSLGVGLVTALPTGLARPLIDSLVNEVVVTDDAFQRDLPREMIPVDEALRLALARVQDLDVPTTWASASGRAAPPEGSAMPASPADASPVPSAPVGRGPEGPQPDDPGWAGGTVLADERQVRADAPPEALFAAVTALGGARGYHSASWMWEIRGLLDELVGGIGLRRGRRHPTQLGVGEVVDFWRVEALERPSLLRLHAEMKMPGEAWLEFRIAPDGDGSRLTQRARFHPRGLWGRLYWYSLVPFHGLIFPRMAREFAQEAEAIHAAGRTEAVPPPPGRRRPRRR